MRSAISAAAAAAAAKRCQCMTPILVLFEHEHEHMLNKRVRNDKIQLNTSEEAQILCCASVYALCAVLCMILILAIV